MMRAARPPRAWREGHEGRATPSWAGASSPGQPRPARRLWPDAEPGAAGGAARGERRGEGGLPASLTLVPHRRTPAGIRQLRGQAFLAP